MHPYIPEYFRRLRLLAWNKREQRPRSLIRIGLFLILYAALFLTLPNLIWPSGDSLLRSATLRVLFVCCTLGLLLGAATYLDKRPVRSFGVRITRRWASDALVGAIIGGTIPIVAVGLGIIGGWITVGEPRYILTSTYLQNIGLVIVITVSIAIAEELVFRGYVPTNAIEGLDLRRLSGTTTLLAAWSVSALLFGLVHSTPTLVAGIHFLSAGLLLGLAYLLSGQLGLPIGIHTGFNFVSGYVVPLTSDQSLIIIPLSVSGPAWLTGQTGLIQTGLQIPAALGILGYFWWRTGRVGVAPRIRSKLDDEWANKIK
jgi:membrane protease YdiL (CAAX protease family)